MIRDGIPVSNIERFAIHDGPGIRTTVFMQGCPLKCQWCANPEAQKIGEHLMFQEQKCAGCGRCVVSCKEAAIVLKGGKASIVREKCIECGACTDACPNGAMRVSGKRMESGDIYDIVIRDKVYYDRTGGGVTFSGGEALTQIEAIAPLIRRLHKSGISVAVETCGYVPGKYMEQAAELMDLFLFDIKTLDSEKMKIYMNGNLSVILDNFIYIAKRIPDKIVARVPVIPGVNKTEEEMRKIFGFIKSNHIERADILPYHTLGITKYRQLGMEYPFACRDSLKPEMLRPYQQLGESMGLHITIGG